MNNMKVVILSTSLRAGSNSHALAEHFAEGASQFRPLLSFDRKVNPAYHVLTKVDEERLSFLQRNR